MGVPQLPLLVHNPHGLVRYINQVTNQLGYLGTTMQWLDEKKRYWKIEQPNDWCQSFGFLILPRWSPQIIRKPFLFTDTLSSALSSWMILVNATWPLRTNTPQYGGIGGIARIRSGCWRVLHTRVEVATSNDTSICWPHIRRCWVTSTYYKHKIL